MVMKFPNVELLNFITMTKEIKDLLKCKHYSEAIKLYNSNENIDIDGFVSYILDIDKCSKSLSFWETLTAEIPFLSELLASERGDELLYNYFSLSKIPLKLTQLIAELNPTIFIIGVRTSRAFMREDFPSIKLPKEIAIHLKVWSYFNKIGRAHV